MNILKPTLNEFIGDNLPDGCVLDINQDVIYGKGGWYGIRGYVHYAVNYVSIAIWQNDHVLEPHIIEYVDRQLPEKILDALRKIV